MLAEQPVLLFVGRGRKETWEMGPVEVMGKASELIVFGLVVVAAVGSV